MIWYYSESLSSLDSGYTEKPSFLGTDFGGFKRVQLANQTTTNKIGIDSTLRDHDMTSFSFDINIKSLRVGRYDPWWGCNVTRLQMIATVNGKGVCDRLKKLWIGLY